jgi:S1-C subfamily serine protease
MKQTWKLSRVGLACAVSLAVAGEICPVYASVPLPMIEHASGMPSLAPVIKKIAPAVVSIAIKAHAPETAATQHKAKDAKQAATDRQPHPAGSGVVIDAAQGIVVTNAHVVEHATEIDVQLSDGREFQATLLGEDPDTDVAVLKIPAEDLMAVTIGDSNKVEVGDFVLAVGNPFLIGQTVSSGIVSGLHRNNVGIEEVENFIQTDAAIYPGNSGGALVNLRGELIGINTAFVGATNVNSGMGFAIPIDMARVVVDRILETGDIRRGRLGITFEDPTPALIRDFKLGAATTAPVITKVEAGSAADRAGLKTGDVITAFAGATVGDMADLRVRLALIWVGEAADFTVLRAGKPLLLHAVVAETPRTDRRAKAK